MFHSWPDIDFNFTVNIFSNPSKIVFPSFAVCLYALYFIPAISPLIHEDFTALFLLIQLILEALVQLYEYVYVYMYMSNSMYGNPVLFSSWIRIQDFGCVICTQLSIKLYSISGSWQAI